MTQTSIDVTTRVSPRLSALFASRANDPDAPQPVTLASVRMFLFGLLSREFKEAERRHHFDLGDSILDELDALIEEFGGEVLAVDFAQEGATEPLSRVIEAVLDDESRDNPPTLATVREAIVAGLPGRLVGEGELEEDEGETVLADIDALIERYGEDSLAEKFVRYE